MGEIWTMGELLVEVMRDKPDIGFSACDTFLGPFPSGAPAIFIDTAARLGHKGGIIGAVGEDDFGACLRTRLERDGVDCRYVSRLKGSTGTAFVAYSSDGSRNYIFHFDGTPAVKAIFEPLERIGELSFFHVMGCSLMASDDFRKEIFAATRWFQNRGAEISFDPNIRAELLGGRPLSEVIGPVLEHASILFPGVQELSLMSGERNVERGVVKMFENPALKILVLKLGSKGCVVYTRDGPIAVPSYPITEKDPTGAGDCFDAGFLCGLSEARELEACAKMASAAGALNAAAFGPMEGDISRVTVSKMTGLAL